MRSPVIEKGTKNWELEHPNIRKSGKRGGISTGAWEGAAKEAGGKPGARGVLESIKESVLWCSPSREHAMPSPPLPFPHGHVSPNL